MTALRTAARRRTGAALAAPAAALLACALAVLVLAVAPAAHAASGDLSWYYTDDSATHLLDGASAAAPAPAGTVYVAATLGSTWTNEEGHILLLRFKPSPGTGHPIVWQRTLNDPGPHIGEYAVAVTADARGNAIVGGVALVTATDTDWVLVKWTPKGKRAWIARYGSPGGGTDELSAMGCDRQGNVYACGRQGAAAADPDWVVAKFRASDGKLLWKRVYSGLPGSDSEDWPLTLAVDASGNSYSAGISDGPAGDRDAFVIKLTARGKTAWTQRIDGAAHSWDEATDVALAGKRLYVGAGMRTSTGGTALNVLRLATADGQEVWRRAIDPGGQDGAWARDLGVDGSGNVVVAGLQYAGGGTVQSAVLASWTPAGAARWSSVFAPAGSTMAALFAVAVDPAGTVWAAGSCGTGGTNDGLLVKYDGTGTQRWAQKFTGDGTGEDWFIDLCLWSPGSLAAVGTTSTVPGGWDLLVAKYVR